MELTLPAARTCSYCYKKLEKMRFCGGCKKHPYCSRECQKKNWKQHKIWCGCGVAEKDIDFELRASTTGGMGLFAVRSFHRGEKIITERCVIQMPEEQVVISRGTMLTNQFESLSFSEQEAVVALSFSTIVTPYWKEARAPER